MKMQFIISILWVMLTFKPSLGLKCYRCDNCPAPEDTALEDCPETIKTGKAKCGTAREDNTVRRFCAYYGSTEHCMGYQCFCNSKDGCNEEDFSQPMPDVKGITCYNCSHCNTIHDSTPVVPCPTGVCFKMTGENDEVIERSCYKDRFATLECGDGICLCGQNKCNGAHGLLPLFWTVILTLLTIVSLKLYPFIMFGKFN